MFLIIISAFAVPAEQQPKALTIGIVIALGLRAVFIALGAALLASFAGRIVTPMATGCSPRCSSRCCRSAAPTSCSRSTRSRPFFGVTDHAYIVLAVNAFALLGFRALYFLLSGLLNRLVYLSTGVAAILAFIGAKLIREVAHHKLTRSRDPHRTLPRHDRRCAGRDHHRQPDQDPTRSELPRPRGSTTPTPRRHRDTPPPRT